MVFFKFNCKSSTFACLVCLIHNKCFIFKLHFCILKIIISLQTGYWIWVLPCIKLEWLYVICVEWNFFYCYIYVVPNVDRTVFLTRYIHIYCSYYPSIRIISLRNYEVNNTVWAESCLLWCVNFGYVHPVCRMLVQLSPNIYIFVIGYIYWFFWHMLTNVFYLHKMLCIS